MVVACEASSAALPLLLGFVSGARWLWSAAGPLSVCLTVGRKKFGGVSGGSHVEYSSYYNALKSRLGASYFGVCGSF